MISVSRARVIAVSLFLWLTCFSTVSTMPSNAMHIQVDSNGNSLPTKVTEVPNGVHDDGLSATQRDAAADGHVAALVTSQAVSVHPRELADSKAAAPVSRPLMRADNIENVGRGPAQNLVENHLDAERRRRPARAPGPAPNHDCQWGQWDEWSDCSRKCGGGDRERLRDVAKEAKFGGAECGGFAEETEDCNTDPCLVAAAPPPKGPTGPTPEQIRAAEKKKADDASAKKKNIAVLALLSSCCLICVFTGWRRYVRESRKRREEPVQQGYMVDGVMITAGGEAEEDEYDDW